MGLGCIDGRRRQVCKHPAQGCRMNERRVKANYFLKHGGGAAGLDGAVKAVIDWTNDVPYFRLGKPTAGDTSKNKVILPGCNRVA